MTLTNFQLLTDLLEYMRTADYAQYEEMELTELIDCMNTNMLAMNEILNKLTE